MAFDLVLLISHTAPFTSLISPLPTLEIKKMVAILGEKGTKTQAVIESTLMKLEVGSRMSSLETKISELRSQTQEIRNAAQAAKNGTMLVGVLCVVCCCVLCVVLFLH
jgi:hypothetical protein